LVDDTFAFARRQARQPRSWQLQIVMVFHSLSLLLEETDTTSFSPSELSMLRSSMNSPPRLIGDKAWDSSPLALRLKEERNIELIAPVRSTSGRFQDGRPLRRHRRRWKVERLFAWLKRFRRIATRWEYKSSNFLGFLRLACAVIMLRHF
jgi:transposase